MERHRFAEEGEPTLVTDAPEPADSEGSPFPIQSVEFKQYSADPPHAHK